MSHDVFISYSSQDREQVLDITRHLQNSGIQVWIDRNRIPGGTNYGPEIVKGIKDCGVLMLMCSDNSLRSKNVKQEIQLAWKYSKPYLPLLLEQISFPEQIEYWLEGWQWIEVLGNPAENWLPQILMALENAGVTGTSKAVSLEKKAFYQVEQVARPVHLSKGLEGLLNLASFTDQIWPLPADRLQAGGNNPITRGLGAPQDDLQHKYRIGSRVSLAIESDREGYLTLLDEGPEGIVYCLCPSWFAPDIRLHSGRNYLPQEGSRYNSFLVTGEPGREQLMAIISDQPLELDWMPADPNIPARTLGKEDINTLMQQLRNIEGDSWSALSTYFDIVAG
ncbi:MAG: TIR domain-containing protein [Anaerolineales bacterium]|jgi:hypothetical protein